jgi:glycosyltransferase involved in cell wall biosynthesis
LIPVYNAGPLLGRVLRELRGELEQNHLSQIPIVVVDDGSTDQGLRDPEIERANVVVLVHPQNRGKGAALLTGLSWAKKQGISFVVTLDADAQHPCHEAIRLYQNEAAFDSLILGVRDLKSAGAPGPSQFSNAFSNRVLSLFGGTRLCDTQCGLRRYPVEITLGLGATHPGYAFESDLVLRAARRGVPIVEVTTDVRYPTEAERVTHFDSVRDPAKIVWQVVKTTLSVPHARLTRRAAEWSLFLILVGAIAALLCI